jgi:hypothetical protein
VETQVVVVVEEEQLLAAVPEAPPPPPSQEQQQDEERQQHEEQEQQIEQDEEQQQEQQEQEEQRLSGGRLSPAAEKARCGDMVATRGVQGCGARPARASNGLSPARGQPPAAATPPKQLPPRIEALGAPGPGASPARGRGAGGGAARSPGGRGAAHRVRGTPPGTSGCGERTSPRGSTATSDGGSAPAPPPGASDELRAAWREVAEQGDGEHVRACA